MLGGGGGEIVAGLAWHIWDVQPSIMSLQDMIKSLLYKSKNLFDKNKKNNYRFD